MLSTLRMLTAIAIVGVGSATAVVFHVSWSAGALE